jgi:hypothetical protein
VLTEICLCDTCSCPLDKFESCPLDNGVETPGGRLVEGLPTRVEQVSCGKAHTAALLRNGAVVSFGNGGNGRLGHGDTLNRLVPTVIKGLARLPPGRSDDGSRMGGGGWEHGRPAAVQCGGAHTTVVSVRGALWCMGDGRDGQLGLGPARMDDVTSPTLVLTAAAAVEE